jgi:hypothetical protein
LKLPHINTNLSKKDFPGCSPSRAAKFDAGYAPLLGKKIVHIMHKSYVHYMLYM